MEIYKVDEQTYYPAQGSMVGQGFFKNLRLVQEYIRNRKDRIYNHTRYFIYKYPVIDDLNKTYDLADNLLYEINLYNIEEFINKKFED